MSYNPNWFYSSLAQCAAAVVGLMGAVLASCLQQQLAAAYVTYNEVATLVTKFRATSQFWIRNNHQPFSQFIDRRIAEVESALDQGDTTITVNQEVHFEGGSRSGPDRIMPVDQNVLEKYKVLRAASKETVAILEGLTTVDNIEDLRAMELSLAQLETILPADVSRDFISRWRDSIRSIEKAYTTHLSTVSIRIPTILTVVLGWL